jgi:two-component system response regulator
MASDNIVEILLVEDNPSDLELALHALRRHHLANRIHVARDGQEALDFLFGPDESTAHPANPLPRVILLDLKLPRIDGFDVLRRLKSDPNLHKVPVVVLTSSREDRDVLNSYRLGVNSYIVKPVDFERFTEAVRQLGLYWVHLNQPPIL